MYKGSTKIQTLACTPFLESPLGLEILFYPFSLLLQRMWIEAEYLFMQSIVELE
jgi:hypothetical protein